MNVDLKREVKKKAINNIKKINIYEGKKESIIVRVNEIIKSFLFKNLFTRFFLGLRFSYNYLKMLPVVFLIILKLVSLTKNEFKV